MYTLIMKTPLMFDTCSVVQTHDSFLSCITEISVTKISGQSFDNSLLEFRNQMRCSISVLQW
jgi:hypothetical protein